MLDTSIQERLRPATDRDRKRKSLVSIILAAAIAPALVGSYFYFANAEAIEDHQLGKLAVLAAESLEESPAGIWVLMERYIGKPQTRFTADDSLRAAKYLMSRIDAGTMKREKASSARLDL